MNQSNTIDLSDQELPVEAVAAVAAQYELVMLVYLKDMQPRGSAWLETKISVMLRKNEIDRYLYVNIFLTGMNWYVMGIPKVSMEIITALSKEAGLRFAKIPATIRVRGKEVPTPSLGPDACLLFRGKEDGFASRDHEMDAIRRVMRPFDEADGISVAYR